jgi:hypothetical protein
MPLNAEVTEFVYTPLPTDGFLKFTIPFKREGKKDAGKPGVMGQPNYFDDTKTDANVQFNITTEGYEKRSVWATYGLYWPKEGTTDTTKLFDLVKALDPAGAIRGQRYDAEKLMGKSGLLMVEDYTKKNGQPGQRVKIVVGSIKEVGETPVAAAKEEPVEAGETKPKRIKI